MSPATTPSPTPTTQPVNTTPANPAPATTPGQPKPKLKKDDLVHHPGDGQGILLAGVGKVVAVEGDSVTVECDNLGKKRNTNFKESDLTPVS